MSVPDPFLAGGCKLNGKKKLTTRRIFHPALGVRLVCRFYFTELKKVGEKIPLLRSKCLILGCDGILFHSRRQARLSNFFASIKALQRNTTAC